MIRLGPILKLQQASHNLWRLSILLVTDAGDPQPALEVMGWPATFDASVLLARSNSRVWQARVEIPLEASARSVQYRVNRQEYEMTVPAAGQAPNIAYVSCNGFSDPKYQRDNPAAFALWQRLGRLHQGVETPQGQRHGPWHLLCFGGDQIYSDALWTKCKTLESWLKKNGRERLKAPFTTTMQQQLESFFENLYLESWSQPDTAAAMASIPSLMMWDDHDIIDGWGSCPASWHDCPVYQGIFRVASTYFRLFQQHLLASHQPGGLPDTPGLTQAFNFGSVGLLALDLRSERRPLSSTRNEPSMIMSPQSWQSVFNWMDQQKGLKHLLVMSSIPVVHAGFQQIQGFLQQLPGQQSLEDDLRDQWTSDDHHPERLRLVYRLLDYAARTGTRVTLLSGDVHVGAVGAIESTRSTSPINTRVINQLTSSGIVHPPPLGLVLFYLNQVCQQKVVLDRGLEATMYPFPGTSRYIIGGRNFLSLEPDPQNRLWANWWVENEPLPTTKAIHPV